MAFTANPMIYGKHALIFDSGYQSRQVSVCTHFKSIYTNT